MEPWKLGVFIVVQFGKEGNGAAKAWGVEFVKEGNGHWKFGLLRLIRKEMGHWKPGVVEFGQEGNVAVETWGVYCCVWEGRKQALKPGVLSLGKKEKDTGSLGC